MTGFFIQCTAHWHIMRDIGNGDTELKATLSLFTPNRIIKISRVFPINGDKGTSRKSTR